MTLPSTKPLDGEFWYVLDDEHNIVWRPRPELRGDFYLGWLSQNKTVLGAGLARIEQGKVSHICTHGTPYYWLQPFEALPLAADTLRAHHVLGADTMALDFGLAGWELRERRAPQVHPWPDAPVSGSTGESLLEQAVQIVLQHFRSEVEPPARQATGGLLARAISAHTLDPQEELLDLLRAKLGEANVVPVLTELVKHDIDVMPVFRQSDFFERLSAGLKSPPPGKVARLVLSAAFHLAPYVRSQRLNNMLLLNSLRQRHPFDVTWGADFLVQCYGMANLVRLLQVALRKEESDQVKGNMLDLLQELGYGARVGLEGEVLNGLAALADQEDLGAFHHVVNSHLAFLEQYVQQRDKIPAARPDVALQRKSG